MTDQVSTLALFKNEFIAQLAVSSPPEMDQPDILYVLTSEARVLMFSGDKWSEIELPTKTEIRKGAAGDCT